MGGEKDGDSYEVSPADVPQVFFAVPHADDHVIKEVKDNDAKREARDRLAVLAYKYHPERSTPERFVMVRTPTLDKVSQP
jgi:hypothetical protein